jgi:electron-transferring-flavoprotein dehydrogenase
MMIKLMPPNDDSEIGSHILSGNVFDPKALYELFPDKKESWTQELLDATGSYATPVITDEFRILPNDHTSWKIPHVLLPPQLHNHGNYIISLSQLTRWLAGLAENEYGVEIFPGFAAASLLYNNDETAVMGVTTRDVGVSKDGTVKDTYEPGVNLVARHTILAEGARGSCSEALMTKFNLRHDCQPQTYGLGIKEVWQIPAEQHQPGFVQHTLGYPLQSSLGDMNFGGSFLYHQEPDLVLIGIVVGLDYRNPYLNPYQEFQRWKLHPDVRRHFQHGTCISYGARVLNEGGYHSIPKLHVPGAVLTGCSAGFLNAVKIKGSHTALQSGKLAAEAIFANLTNDDDTMSSVAETGEFDPTTYQFADLQSYGDAIQQSWIAKELYEVRNAHAAFARFGVAGGLVHAGFTAHITKGREPWTLSGHAGGDSTTTEPADQHHPIIYPPPDHKITFDLLTNLQRSGTYHAEDQPCHLRIKPNVDIGPSLAVYAGPEQRFCPAGVYEYVNNDDNDEDDNGAAGVAAGDGQIKKKKLVINSQNCIHCKCCSIKMPNDYIDWTVPEGSGGPQYRNM